MAKGINKVILIGNVGQVPEIRATTTGSSVCTMRLATSETWKDKSTGETKQNTEWHSLVFFGNQAEIAYRYVQKGAQIYVEGRLQTRKWKDKDNNDRYSTEIVVSDLKLLGAKPDSANPQPADDGSRRSPAQQAARAANPQPAPAGNFDDDDIQF